MGPLGVVTFQSDHGSLLLPLGGVFSFIIWGWGGKVNGGLGRDTKKESASGALLLNSQREFLFPNILSNQGPINGPIPCKQGSFILALNGNSSPGIIFTHIY